jgi:uncharacterized protein (DUF1501 family)
LAEKLKNIARLIDAGLETTIYYVSLDGFDTHANQRQSHANLMTELAESVAAFFNDLATRGHLDRTTVLMFSEFGRRVKENASLGDRSRRGGTAVSRRRQAPQGRESSANTRRSTTSTAREI